MGTEKVPHSELHCSKDLRDFHGAKYYVGTIRVVEPLQLLAPSTLTSREWLRRMLNRSAAYQICVSPYADSMAESRRAAGVGGMEG